MREIKAAVGPGRATDVGESGIYVTISSSEQPKVGGELRMSSNQQSLNVRETSEGEK